MLVFILLYGKYIENAKRDNTQAKNMGRKTPGVWQLGKNNKLVSRGTNIETKNKNAKQIFLHYTKFVFLIAVNVSISLYISIPDVGLQIAISTLKEMSIFIVPNILLKESDKSIDPAFD